VDDEAKSSTELIAEVRALRARAQQLEVARERQAFLADAGAVLAESLDYVEQLRRVARLAVPRIADWCALDLVAEDGTLQRLAVEHVDPAKVALAYELQRRYPPDPNANTGVYHVLRTGQPIFYPEIGDDMLVRAARDAEHLRILREVGLVSAITVPLTARRQTLGAITLVTDVSGRRYTPDDVAFAAEFARNAALVIDNARLHGEMRRSRDEIDAILRGVDGGITVQDTSGRLIYANDAAARLCGYDSAAELLAAPLADVIGRFAVMDEEGQPLPLDQLPGRRALMGQAGVEALLRFRVLASGEERWSLVRATPVYHERGGVVRAVNTFQEVTAIKYAEEALREQREWLSVTLASIGDAVIATDARGLITFMNPIAQALTGWLEGDARGRDLAEVFRIVNETNRAPVESPVVRVLREGTVVGLANHTLLIAKDGAERAIDDSGAPLRDASGNLIGVVLVFRDIAERRQAERRLLAQYAVARVLAEARDLPAAMPSILSAVCTSLEWNWGAMWLVDEAAGALACAATWQAPAFEGLPFTEHTYRTQFAPGVGLPGRVWSSGEAAWIADIATDTNFPRAPAALGVGLRTIFAVPIRLGGATLGVLEFANRAHVPSDEAIMVMMLAVGNQVGQFIERKRAEEVLARYQLLSHYARDIILFIDRHGWIIEANHAAELAYGYTRAELLGMRIFDLRAAETRMSIEAQMAEADREGVMFETFHRRKNGQVFPVEVSSRGTMIGAERVLVSIIRDITARKQAEDRRSFLAEANAVLAASLDYETTLQNIARLAVPRIATWCAVHILEPDGNIRRLAVAHADPAKEALARARPECYPIDSHARHIVPQVIRTGQSELYQKVSEELLANSARDPAHFELLRALGVASYLCVAMRHLGRVLGAITLARADARQRYEPEDLALAEELAYRAAIAVDNARLYREAQDAIRLRDQFLSIASHELKTPLTSLLGNAQMLHRRAVRDYSFHERDLRPINVIADQAGRLNRMIGALLDVSRIQMGQLSIERQPFDLCDLARRVVSEVQPIVERHTLECQAEGALVVAGDELRLEQVLQNLIQNAIKYSPDGGTVRVRAGREGDRAVVAVSDEGIGIPASELSQLFQRFYRAANVDERHISGMGVGLYVVREIVSLHGGDVAVTSEEGRGSTFTFWLPLAA
jgi:PAS domain S-box-containing protein